MMHNSTIKFNANKHSFKINKGFFCAFISAFLVLLICSKSSPLYPFNDWVDSNAYFTVGKSILKGFVPYRDLFDHKGPLLYLIHSIACIVSSTTFIGVWFLEIISATVFLYNQYRIIRLYSNSVYNKLYIFIISAITYSSIPFCHGDSVEEFSLPFISYAIYVGLKALKENRLPTNKEFLFIGLTSACVMWMKYTIIGIYIGWFAFFFVWSILKKCFPKLLTGVVYIVVGVALVSLPILLYFVFNSALMDMLNVYFYENIFKYAAPASLSVRLLSLGKVFKNIIVPNLLLFVFALLGLFCLLIRKKYNQICFFIATSAMLFLIIYIGGMQIKYYSFPFYVYMYLLPFVIKTLAEEIPIPTIKKHLVTVSALVIAFSIIFSYFKSGNTYMLKYKKEELPQYKFAKTINEKENATLLNYYFLDGGFYTASNIIPNCKFFYTPNVDIEKIKAEQDKYVKNGSVDFLVTRNLKLNLPNYECIDEASLPFEGYNFTYYLYKLK